MKILLLGPSRPHTVEYLSSFGDEVLEWEDPLEGGSSILDGVDFLISYGYRHILGVAVLDRFPGRIINLHISLLPWNRGADPNLWSFLEETPKGVSIHLVDRGVDTGPLLAQRSISFGGNETLRTSYERLSSEIEALFEEIWPEIRSGKREPRPQPEGGSFHRKADKKPFERLLDRGWDTPVAALSGKAGRLRSDA